MHLSRALCLILVLSTGFGGIAFADHGGSHGSHCIEPSEEEASASHSHWADHHQTSADAAGEGNEQSCVQHSCVVVFASMAFEARIQRLASDMLTIRGDLLRASLSAESLHRPPIA